MSPHDQPLTTQFPAVDEAVILDYGLRAQARMLPYALGFFGVGLPPYLWAASYFMPPAFIVLSLTLFAVNWGFFHYLRAKSRALLTPEDQVPPKAFLARRMVYQGASGALWVAGLMILSYVAALSGHNAHIFLLICAGAAVGIIFFCTPVLRFLLTLGPLAATGPVIALKSVPGGQDLSNLAIGGMALALALGFILNRHLREHYQLAHDQLRLARERNAAVNTSESLSASKIALMHTLSDELRTGLKGLSASLHTGLTQASRAPAIRQHIYSALNEAQHLENMLVTTLDNDTAEQGLMQITPEALDIDAICVKVIEDFSAQATAKGLELALNLEAIPHKGAVMADGARVTQILSHLVSNALAYTARGRVELKVSMMAEDVLRVDVLDTGPGLDADELDQAFKAHTRIARTAAGHSGAGLGLSLSKRLISMMGGRIGADSTVGLGSKFWVELVYDREARRPVKPDTAPPAVAAEMRNSLRVLLLSNDSLRSAQLRDSLERLGHKCLTSTTRERALSLAGKVELDACLIATGPLNEVADADGRETLEAFLYRLRTSQSEAAIQILALLPQGDHADILRDMGVKPLILPQSEADLNRALSA
ncbi:ATP-binding response regulator [Asticcacaulis endophyticus]|uniref:histidine kinase n=1 Tax=Asticcacaulis endophyticus TaxID=1395890 RepID=A0A918UXT0_9CAUL|nr:hybrid sensor histidine kinase/response regulator [Asticcacaulis endophyticus]GGZ42341.1 hybrid sensor histidine kinase/response regulator [Asticcacaulis endophyticus]